MAEITKQYWLHALTPLHVGSGVGLGFVDLPIMREKTTKWPMVPGSAVKGVLADHYHATDGERKDDPLKRAAFGIADEDEAGQAQSNSGALVFTDARLVCLAVCSLYGTFAWITSPLALRRLKRDIDAANLASGLPDPPTPGDGKILLPQFCCLNGGTEKVYIADLDIAREKLDPTKPADAAQSEAAKKWQVYLTDALFKPGDLWRAEFQKRFAILNDRFFDYLCETATQVDARIKIDPNRGTVDKEHGALWYEESVPAESILAGVVWCDRVYPKDAPVTPEKLLSTYCKTVSLQIGGKATVGKGRVRFVTAVEEAQP
jgi:CRISPR-associated protein Cmr4